MVSRAFREHVIILIGLFLFLLPYSMAWAFSGDTDKHHADTAESGLPRMAKPNIVWIVLDACRAQNLSCYGYNRQTSPNIDNLASSGVLFERHYAQASWTFPSLPSYMSGRYFPADCLDSGDWRVQTAAAPAPDERLLPELLSEDGYQTAMVCMHSWFTPFCRFWKAFDAAVRLDPDDPDVLAKPLWPSKKRVVRAIEDILDARTPSPLFLYIHLMYSHFPHRHPAPFTKWIDSSYSSPRIVNGGLPTPAAEPFSEREKALLCGLYDAGILYSDDVVGAILATIRNTGLFENTIFIIGADHGEVLGEDGKTVGHSTVCEEVLHVPLILSGPGIPAGFRVEEMTENVDIVPTLVKLLHIRTSATFEGRDLALLWPNAAEVPKPQRDFVIAKFQPQIGDVPKLILRDRHFGYEFDIESETGRLYEAPMSIVTMNDVSPRHPERAAAMKTRILNYLVPKWRDFSLRPNAPVAGPFLMRLKPEFLSPQNAIVSEGIESAAALGAAESKKWRLIGGTLVGEDATTLPDVEIKFEIPNGTYNVRAESSMGIKPLYKVQMLDGADFHDVLEIRRDAQYFVNLGQYEVRERTFRMVFRPSEDGETVFLGKFLFTPISIEDSIDVADDAAEQEELLRAMGYL